MFFPGSLSTNLQIPQKYLPIDSSQAEQVGPNGCSVVHSRHLIVLVANLVGSIHSFIHT